MDKAVSNVVTLADSIPSAEVWEPVHHNLAWRDTPRALLEFIPEALDASGELYLICCLKARGFSIWPGGV